MPESLNYDRATHAKARESGDFTSPPVCVAALFGRCLDCRRVLWTAVRERPGLQIASHVERPPT